MSPLTGLARDRDDGFPRVSGDEPHTAPRCAVTTRFPRVSGDEPTQDETR